MCTRPARRWQTGSFFLLTPQREQESVLNHSFNRLELTSDLTEGENTALIFETEPPGVADDISKVSSHSKVEREGSRVGISFNPSFPGSSSLSSQTSHRTQSISQKIQQMLCYSLQVANLYSATELNLRYCR